MARPKREANLRRLVADLALAPPGDVQAILDELDETQRDKVSRLLAEYSSEAASEPTPPPQTSAEAPAPTPAPAPEPLRIDGLSPWLEHRLSPALRPTAPQRDPRRSMMAHILSAPHITPASVQMLRRCADRLLENGALRPRTPTPPPRGPFRWFRPGERSSARRA